MIGVDVLFSIAAALDACSRGLGPVSRRRPLQPAWENRNMTRKLAQLLFVLTLFALPRTHVARWPIRSHRVMAMLAAAVERGDPRTRQLWFDVATVADQDITPEDAAGLARRIRQVGVERVLYGSDAAAGNNLRPREGWAACRRLPLTDGEFARVARNVAPYMR
jgi:hypothetical protein